MQHRRFRFQVHVDISLAAAEAGWLPLKPGYSEAQHLTLAMGFGQGWTYASAPHHILTWVLQPVDDLLPEALRLVDGHGVSLHDDGDDGHVLAQLSHVAAARQQHDDRQ
jgi:hypothetical protein